MTVHWLQHDIKLPSLVLRWHLEKLNAAPKIGVRLMVLLQSSLRCGTSHSDTLPPVFDLSCIVRVQMLSVSYRLACCLLKLSISLLQVLPRVLFSTFHWSHHVLSYLLLATYWLACKWLVNWSSELDE